MLRLMPGEHLTLGEYREVLDIDAGVLRCSVCDQVVDQSHCPCCCLDQLPAPMRECGYCDGDTDCLECHMIRACG